MAVISEQNRRDWFSLARNEVYISCNNVLHQQLVSKRHSNICHAKDEKISVSLVVTRFFIKINLPPEGIINSTFRKKRRISCEYNM